MNEEHTLSLRELGEVKTIKVYNQAYVDKQQKQIEELKAQIEQMKCGGNCKHLYHVNTGGCYDTKCDLTYCDCINCKDKWEIKENDR